MTGERRVWICFRRRRVEFCENGGEAVEYPGVAITRLVDGQAVHEAWVPFGTEPSYADDEALLGHLRDAWSWRNHPAGC